MGMPNRIQKDDDRYVMSRAEDRSVWIRTAYVLEKYKILVWILICIAIAVGFDFKTPHMVFADLQDQIVANKRFVDSTVVPRIQVTDTKLDVLLKLNCLNKSLTDAQLALAGLNCPEGLRP